MGFLNYTASMTTKFVLITLLVSTISAFCADSKAKFAPEFFVFENGVRFGPTENQIKVLKELGWNNTDIGNTKHKDIGYTLGSYLRVKLSFSFS